MFTSFRVPKFQLTKTRFAGRTAARFKALRDSFDLILPLTRANTKSRCSATALIPFRERVALSPSRNYDVAILTLLERDKTVRRKVNSATTTCTANGRKVATFFFSFFDEFHNAFVSNGRICLFDNPPEINFPVECRMCPKAYPVHKSVVRPLTKIFSLKRQRGSRESAH